MPKFEVMRETVDVATGRVWPAGSVVEYDPPKIMRRDVEGRPVLDKKTGEPVFDPSEVSSNLRPVKAPEAPKTPA